MGWHVSL